MLEKETQKHIRLENLLRMLSESSFIESSIFDLESGFSIVESGFLKRESEHESGFFPSPGFLRVRVQVRVRVRSGFRSMPLGLAFAVINTLWIVRFAENLDLYFKCQLLARCKWQHVLLHNSDCTCLYLVVWSDHCCEHYLF